METRQREIHIRPIHVNTSDKSVGSSFILLKTKIKLHEKITYYTEKDIEGFGPLQTYRITNIQHHSRYEPAIDGDIEETLFTYDGVWGFSAPGRFSENYIGKNVRIREGRSVDGPYFIEVEKGKYMRIV